MKITRGDDRELVATIPVDGNHEGQYIVIDCDYEETSTTFYVRFISGDCMSEESTAADGFITGCKYIIIYICTSTLIDYFYSSIGVSLNTQIRLIIVNCSLLKCSATFEGELYFECHKQYLANCTWKGGGKGGARGNGGGGGGREVVLSF